ncbi:SCP2 domain-containing protein [Pantoea sp. KPR_PJ]|uniref:ubiquinone anaerobic biosynthesis accessory factor UbiT n=1 Tax=Pantoea sp. KPR_PJ TaxID=2738375 RepID=UPI003527683B
MPVFEQLRAELVKKAPKILSLPVALTPYPVKRALLQQLLNWQFRHALAEGELDFLQARHLGIEIADVNLRWITTIEEGQLVVVQDVEADVWFRGNANDLLLVAARKADPDMLFFQRRLLIEGDTELGLEVKNLMDALELEAMPTALRTGLQQLAAFVEAGMKQDAMTAQARAESVC